MLTENEKLLIGYLKTIGIPRRPAVTIAGIMTGRTHLMLQWIHDFMKEHPGVDPTQEELMKAALDLTEPYV